MYEVAVPARLANGVNTENHAWHCRGLVTEREPSHC